MAVPSNHITIRNSRKINTDYVSERIDFPDNNESSKYFLTEIESKINNPSRNSFERLVDSVRFISNFPHNITVIEELINEFIQIISNDSYNRQMSELLKRYRPTEKLIRSPIRNLSHNYYYDFVNKIKNGQVIHNAVNPRMGSGTANFDEFSNRAIPHLHGLLDPVYIDPTLPMMLSGSGIQNIINGYMSHLIDSTITSNTFYIRLNDIRRDGSIISLPTNTITLANIMSEEYTKNLCFYIPIYDEETTLENSDVTKLYQSTLHNMRHVNYYNKDSKMHNNDPLSGKIDGLDSDVFNNNKLYQINIAGSSDKIKFESKAGSSVVTMSPDSYRQYTLSMFYIVSIANGQDHNTIVRTTNQTSIIDLAREYVYMFMIMMLNELENSMANLGNQMLNAAIKNYMNCVRNALYIRTSNIGNNIMDKNIHKKFGIGLASDNIRGSLETPINSQIMRIKLPEVGKISERFYDDNDSLLYEISDDVTKIKFNPRAVSLTVDEAYHYPYKSANKFGLGIRYVHNANNMDDYIDQLKNSREYHDRLKFLLEREFDFTDFRISSNNLKTKIKRGYLPESYYTLINDIITNNLNSMRTKKDTYNRSVRSGIHEENKKRYQKQLLNTIKLAGNDSYGNIIIALVQVLREQQLLLKEIMETEANTDRIKKMHQEVEDINLAIISLKNARTMTRTILNINRNNTSDVGKMLVDKLEQFLSEIDNNSYKIYENNKFYAKHLRLSDIAKTKSLHLSRVDERIAGLGMLLQNKILGGEPGQIFIIVVDKGIRTDSFYLFNVMKMLRDILLAETKLKSLKEGVSLDTVRRNINKMNPEIKKLIKKLFNPQTYLSPEIKLKDHNAPDTQPRNYDYSINPKIQAKMVHKTYEAHIRDMMSNMGNKKLFYIFNDDTDNKRIGLQIPIITLNNVKKMFKAKRTMNMFKYIYNFLMSSCKPGSTPANPYLPPDSILSDTKIDHAIMKNSIANIMYETLPTPLSGGITIGDESLSSDIAALSSVICEKITTN